MIQDFLIFLLYVVIVQTITFITVAIATYLYYPHRYKTIGGLLDAIDGFWYVPILSTASLILYFIIDVFIIFSEWSIKVTKLRDLWKKIRDIKI